MDLQHRFVTAGQSGSVAMVSSKRGREYENELTKNIYVETDGALIPETIGYSGNGAVPAPDIRIDDGTKVHAFELKRTSADRLSFQFDPDDRQKDDADQLFNYCRQYPRTVVPYLGVRFDNRQLIILQPWLGAPNNLASLRGATKTTPLDVNLTRAHNLSVQKPSTDEWPSATKGDDVQHVLDTINFEQTRY